MKILSLEETDCWINLCGTCGGGVHISRPILRKILHTAREYHRVREALEFYAANTKFDRADMQWKNDNGAKAREALRESEGDNNGK